MVYKNNRTKNRRRYKTRYKTPHNYKTKKGASNSRPAVIFSVITFLVLAAVILVFAFGDNIYNFLDTSFNHIATTETETVLPTNSSKVIDTQKPTQVATNNVNQSSDFLTLCNAASLDVNDLDSKQIIFVKCSGTTCTLSTYEDKDGLYSPVLTNVSGNISQDGTASDMGPYDRYTPLGNFDIEFAFGTSKNPGTKLDYEDVNQASYWITDPSSLNYNKMIGDYATLFDFDTAINLWEYTVSYEYAIVFSYNRNPVDSSKGCAKFLHIGPSIEYGGVGIDRDNLVNVLKWLDPAKKPIICIFQ